ncbi:MAG: DoxX family protein [Bacteroidota bacterium]
MKTAFRIVQVLLGAFMLIIGINKFLMFIDIPSPSGDGGELMRVYIHSGFLKLVGVLEALAGIALLLNRFVPLGLIFITAIMFNATIFHVLHDPAGTGPAAFCLLLAIGSVYAQKDRFSTVLSA